MKISLLPVYSKLAEEKDIPSELLDNLPPGWRLSRHQVETYKALTQGEADVVFNTAMTGDGKSLAGQLVSLVRGGIAHPVFAMYPTNELINDQQVHLEQIIKTWEADINLKVLNSAVLDQIMLEENYYRRGDALMRILHNGDIVLSNPDIFHYVMHQFYTFPQDAPDLYAAPLTQKFRQLTFDEFHIFEAPQIVSVLNALLFMQEIGGKVRKHVFLFLSATPKKLLLDYLHCSGLKIIHIEGDYATQGDDKHWRKILNPIELNFESEPRAENWVDIHLDDILLPFFLERRMHAKGAIIVNSVAAAHRIYEKLNPVFYQHELHVELNTGLTSRSRRKISYQADLLIGTSTVDVGVDFQINFLVFESRDSGSFLQRLGRLGRHDVYQHNGRNHTFHDYYAYALLPEWIVQRLFTRNENSAVLFNDGDTVERPILDEAIESAFPSLAEFEQYARTWGKLQSVKLLMGLKRKPIFEQYKESYESLRQRYEETFKIRIPAAIGKYKELAKHDLPLLDAALSFRGSNVFPCCVIDLMEPLEQERFKCVDLLQMAANYKLEYLDAKSFYAEASAAGLNTDYFKKQEPLGFFRLKGISEYEKITFWLGCDLLHWGAEEYGKAKVMKGLNLDACVPGINEINRRLSRRAIPALLCVGMKPLEMKRRLGLPILFPLYDFESQDGVSGTVAFGRTALMLDSRLLYLPLRCGGEVFII